jgi:hypothetical protein
MSRPANLKPREMQLRKKSLFTNVLISSRCKTPHNRILQETQLLPLFRSTAATRHRKSVLQKLSSYQCFARQPLAGTSESVLQKLQFLPMFWSAVGTSKHKIRSAKTQFLSMFWSGSHYQASQNPFPKNSAFTTVSVGSGCKPLQIAVPKKLNFYQCLGRQSGMAQKERSSTKNSLFTGFVASPMLQPVYLYSRTEHSNPVLAFSSGRPHVGQASSLSLHRPATSVYSCRTLGRHLRERNC